MEIPLTVMPYSLFGKKISSHEINFRVHWKKAVNRQTITAKRAGHNKRQSKAR
jgi:hypothetical protein